MRLLRHNLARLACGANMVCTQMRSTELGRHAKPGGRRSPRHRRGSWWSPPAHQCLRQDPREPGDGGGSGWGTPPGQGFEFRHKTRADPVADAIGESLLLGQRGGPDQRSGNQQLVSVVDPPEGFGVAPHVRVVDLHQTPMGSLHGGLGCAPGELKDG